MTGVEAVSNGVTVFSAPTVPNAQRTLTVIVGILGLLLGGIAYLVPRLSASAPSNQDKRRLPERPVAAGRGGGRAGAPSTT